MTIDRASEDSRDMRNNAIDNRNVHRNADCRGLGMRAQGNKSLSKSVMLRGLKYDRKTNLIASE